MSIIRKSVREKAQNLATSDDPPSRRKLTKAEEEARQIRREELKQHLIYLMLHKKAQA